MLKVLKNVAKSGDVNTTDCKGILEVGRCVHISEILPTYVNKTNHCFTIYFLSWMTNLKPFRSGLILAAHEEGLARVPSE